MHEFAGDNNFIAHSWRKCSGTGRGFTTRGKKGENGANGKRRLAAGIIMETNGLIGRLFQHRYEFPGRQGTTTLFFLIDRRKRSREIAFQARLPPGFDLDFLFDGFPRNDRNA